MDLLSWQAEQERRDLLRVGNIIELEVVTDEVTVVDEAVFVL